jgi:LuxR family maltose regulon positive regulatory protein
MLTPLDAAHSWFRCHTMLREVLRGELEAREPARAAEVHRRTSAWYAERGDVERALDHAVAARDAARVAELLWSHVAQFLYGRDALVHRWLQALGPDALAAEPRLAACAAHSALALGDLPSARHWAHAASAAIADGEPQPGPAAGATLIEAAAGADGLEQTAATAASVATVGRGENPLQPFAWLLEGVARHVLGDGQEARELLERTVDECATEMPWLEALALTELAIVDVADEDWERAQERIVKARDCLELAGLASHPTAALIHAVAALVASRRGLADEAKGELANASRLLAALTDYMPWYEVQARVVMARASTRLADVARARTLLSQASRLARRPRPLPRLLASLDEAWAEIDDVSAAALNGPGSLTMAELRVLRFLPTHLSFREIGERLHVSGNTVKSQAHAIYAKLGAASRSEAVAHASALGLIDAAVV